MRTRPSTRHGPGLAIRDRTVELLHRFKAVRAIGRRALRGRTVRQPFHGGVICLDAVQHSWAWTGAIRLESWDRSVQDRLLALSLPCSTFVDIGSNVGTMALSVALRNRSIGVVCVEPNRRASELLARSIAENGLGDRVTIIAAAAAPADGELAFDEGGSTTGHVSAAGAFCCPTVSLGRIVADAASAGPLLLKIDVEGFETVLLPVLARADDRRAVTLVAELHASGFNGVGDPNACVGALRRSGAVVIGPSGARIETVEPWTDPVRTMQIEARWS